MFGGFRVLESHYALEPVAATVWTEPPFSKHRSKRLWKKLRLRTARPHPGNPICLQMGDTLIMHPYLRRHLENQ